MNIPQFGRRILALVTLLALVGLIAFQAIRPASDETRATIPIQAIAASEVVVARGSTNEPLSVTEARNGNPQAVAREPKPYVFSRAVVLCIGIDKYRFVNELKFAEPDAKAVGEAFHARYGFSP